MRIFLAGGSGVIGSRLIPALISAGHDVTAITRRLENVRFLERLGAHGAAVDVYNSPHLNDVVADAKPDLVIHELTDLGDFDLEANARIRRAGTANLVAASRAAGVERMIVQSIAWAYEPGDDPATEMTPLVSGTAISVMEANVRQMPSATVLRYGTIYGPGTWYWAGAPMANAAMAGLLPATPVIMSFVHIDDAVRATVQSIGWPDGAYNIVDDEPAAGTEWVPVFAAGAGAPVPKPSPVPSDALLGRGALNGKARRCGWEPEHPSWRAVFRCMGTAQRTN